MPAVVGALRIVNVGSASIVHIGDSVQLAPYSISKTFAGAGSFNTGDHLKTYNMVSHTNTYDNDVTDASIASADKAGAVL